MRVTGIKTTALSLPWDYSSTGAAGARINPVIVQLATDEGLEGFGLCFCSHDKRVKSLKACLL